MPAKKKARRPVRRKLVAVGGGPYVLDAAGQLFRLDAEQEQTTGPDGEVVVTTVALLTPLEVRYADDG